MDLEDEFFFCSPIETTTTGAGTFSLMDKFQLDEGLNWNNCISLCTDGAPAMLGADRDFTALVKLANPSVGIFTAFFIAKI